MSAGTERMPACIFDEMAGVRDITPPQSPTAEDNVNQERIYSEVDEGRLEEASIILLEKAPQFQEYILELAKKLLEYQKGEDGGENPIVPKAKPLSITVIIKGVASLGKKTADLLEKMVNWFKEKCLGVLKSIVKGIIKAALWILKWAFKIMWKVVKIIMKLLWKVVKLAFKLIVKLLKMIMKMLGKVMRWIWKGIVALAKAFWKLMKKLFIKKKKPKPEPFLLKEPKGLIPKDPTINPPAAPGMQTEMSIIEKNNKAEIKVSKVKKFKMAWAKANKIRKSFTFKGMKQQVETFLWKIIKKILKMFWELIRKLIRKIFGKIIDKLIDTVVKIIVRFIMMQIIGSLLPGLGNAFALAMTAVNAIMLIGGAIMFIKGLVDTVNDLADGMGGNEADDDTDDEEDEEKEGGGAARKKEASDYRNRMKELAAEGKANTAEYYDNKRQYMTELLKQAQSSGNAAEVKALREAMGITVDSSGRESSPNMEAIANVDLEALNKRLAEEQEKEFYINKEKNKAAIINKDELEGLLVAADGEPEWMVIVKRLVTNIHERIEKRYKDKRKYRWAVWNAFNLAGKPEVRAEYVVDRQPWIAFHAKRKMNKVRYAKVASDILTWINSDKPIHIRNNTTLSALFTILFNHPTHIFKLKDMIDDNKTNFMDETEEYRKSIKEANMLERRKTNAWIDILILLSVRKAMRSK